MAFLPCAPSIFAPDGYLREPDALAPCMEAAELEFAHGYRAHDTRDNVFYTARGEVVYHTAALGVVYDRETNTQRFLTDTPTTETVTGHCDDILCVARHPTGSIFATGEVGRNPKVLVWSSDDTKKPLVSLQVRLVFPKSQHCSARLLRLFAHTRYERLTLFFYRVS